MKSSHKPARTMDEVVEDDPYRVIMFSDIEGFLITLPTQADDLRKLCIDAFLLFCRLPPIATLGSNTSRKWASDAFVRNDLLECRPAWMKAQYFTKSQHGSEDNGMPSFQQNSFPNCLASPELLFGTGIAGNCECTLFCKPSMLTNLPRLFWKPQYKQYVPEVPVPCSICGRQWPRFIHLDPQHPQTTH